MENKSKIQAKHQNKSKTMLLTMLLSILTIFSMAIETKAAYQQAESQVELSTMSVYKDMDTSFLKEFPFGTTNETEPDLQFATAQELIDSYSRKLVAGKIVQTQGFYTPDDGGGATYLICETQPSYSIELSNGLYAQLIPDKKLIDNNQWAVINIRQLGAKGDGEGADHIAINAAIECGGAAAKEEDVFRSFVYIPEGQYRCGNEIQCNVQKVNLVGEGEASVLFTDNNYRKDENYAEFFFQSWGGEQLYLGNFRIEAREIDYKKYMRQVVFIYCNDVYLYQVDMIVPQEAVSGFYFEDRQYTNLTFYSGNQKMTADSCYLSQMSGSYRGANIGVLDLYSKGEQDITIMNCELYDNARDEQVGMFSGLNREDTYIKNVDFINNTMHSYQPPNLETSGGWRTMCFTVAYNESTNMDNIRIAGNHFISEVDSKFMTFGNVTNCVVENNMIEILATYGNFGYGFESGNSDAENVKIRNNEIFLSAKQGETGGKTMLSGPAVFNGNKIVSDVILNVGYDRGIYNDNKVVSVGRLGEFVKNAMEVNRNELTIYGSMGQFFTFAGGFTREEGTANINDNKIINYQRESKRKGVWDALNNVNGGYVQTVNFTGNTYLAPNKQYWDEVTRNQMVNTFYFRGYGSNLGNTYYIANNILQGVKDFVAYDAGDTSAYIQYEGNTIQDYTYEENIPICTEISITQNGIPQTEIFTTADTLSLGTLVKAGLEGEDGSFTEIQEVTDKEIHWFVSLEGMASVENGVVTRKEYGDVTVYAVPTDGSGVYGKCVIHFASEVAAEVLLEKEQLTMQAGYVHDVVYQVLPKAASQTLKWTSSNPEVAEVTYDGIVKAVSDGTAEITCATMDGSQISKVIQVCVEPLTVKRIDLNYSYYEFDTTSGTVQLETTNYVPENAVNLSVGKWSSTNNSVATVDQNGLVTVKSHGVAEIRAYTTDGLYYGSCNIYVTPEKLTQIEVSCGNTWVKLKWEAQENVYGYYVYQYDPENDKWNNVATVKENHYEAWNLTADTDYQYRVTGYVARWDSAGQKHNYENLSDIIKFHTDDKSYIKKLNKVPEAIGVKLGEPKDVTFYYNKEDLTLTAEDNTIISAQYRPGSEGLSNIEERIEGLQEGRTNLIVKANDGGGFEMKIPVLVRDFDSIKDGLELTSAVNALKLKWKVTDTETITGFSIHQWPDDIIYIPMEEIKVETEEDGTKYCTYVYQGLKENVEYRIQVAPYVELDGYRFEGPISEQKRAKPLSYTDNSQIETEELHIISVGQEKVISAKNTLEEALDKQYIWTSYEPFVVDVKEEKLEGNTAYAKIKGLKAGIVKVEISNEDKSNWIDTKVVVLPGKVENLKAVETSKKFTLTWDKIDGVKGYKVYQRNADTNSWEELGETTEAVYVDKNLEKGKDYQYKVKAYLTDNNRTYFGEFSQVITLQLLEKDGEEHTVTVQPTETVTPTIGAVSPSPSVVIPTVITPTTGAGTVTETVSAAPTEGVTNTITQTPETAKEKAIKQFSTGKVEKFTIVKTYTNKIKLKWTSLENATGYKIYMYQSGKWKLLKDVKSTATNTLTVKNLKAGTGYKFRICGYMADNNSQNTYTSKYKNLSAMTLPKKTNITKITADTGKVKVQWKKVKCSGYQIQYSTSKKFTSSKKTVNVSKKKTKYTIKNLKSSKKYYVRIRPYVKVNGKKTYGAWSKAKIVNQ